MRIKEITVGKEFKVGLPSFSNITVGAELKVEVEDGEEVNWDLLWDTLNQQLSIQSDTVDPSWITRGEYRNFFKTIIKTPKSTIDKE